MKLILASGSPRRKQILQDSGFVFTIRTKDTEESFPADMAVEQVPVLLAERKATAFLSEITDEVILAADTVVIIENRILNKPADSEEAFEMLSLLSGKRHDVITGVCLLSQHKKVLFSDKTEVYFKNITDEEINYYIKTHKPFDKAGAYGTQEWMGMVGIEKIIGSYFNVMGLPIHKVYDELKTF